MDRTRALLAALLLALAVQPSQQLPAGAGFHCRRLAGSGHEATGAGSSGNGLARRRLAAAQPLTPVSADVLGQEVLYQVPKQPIGMVVLLHKCGRSAGACGGGNGSCWVWLGDLHCASELPSCTASNCRACCALWGG